jgi:hypothetical protein
MKSKHILILHTILFTTFVIGSILSSIVVIFFPELLSGRHLFYFLIVLAVLIIGSWPLFGGCPFTKWENYHRERENPGSAYSGSCIVRYLKKWFNVNFPEKFHVLIPITFLILPAVVSVLYW